MTDHSPVQPDLRPALTGPPDVAQSESADFGPLPQEEASSVDVRRVLAAVMRRKWLLVILTILGSAGGVAGFRVIPLQYNAQATLWIQASGGQGGAPQAGPIQPAELLQWSSWVDLLKSYVVLDEVVRRQHVYLEPRDPADSAIFNGFTLKPAFVPGRYRVVVSRDGRTYSLTIGDKEVGHGAVGDSIGAAVGFEWTPSAKLLPPGQEVRFRVQTPRDAALSLQDQLKSILPEQGSFLKLELTGSNPVATAAILNSIAERFVEVAAELKRQKLTELSKILDDQLTSAYTALGNAERALETFKVHTITLPSEQASPVTPGLQQTENPVFSAFFDMRINRDQLDRDRRSIEAALAQPDSTVSAMQLEAIPSVRQSSELSAALSQLASKEADARAMRLQFGASYPTLRQTETEIADLRRGAIPQLAQKLVTDLSGRIRDMDARIASASTELQQIPQRAIEEARLQRDVTIAEQLYTTLQQRYEEARLAEVSSIPDVRVLDRAVPPEQPLKNRAMMILLGGVFGGFGGAVVLAIFLDRVDRRVRYPEQVTLGMGLPILGALPRLKNGGGRGGVQTEAQVVEALRAIRLNLEHAYGAAGPLVITITSPAGGDGKSFLASNLAVSFADAGHRTIVVDGDIRRGSLHRVFDLQRKPGLLDLLSGQAAPGQIIQRTKIKGVEFIGCGTRRSAGPELLASAAMSQLLISLRSTYGVIIIDCAPLGAGVDPLVVGSLTGNLVLVLRNGVSDREFAMAKLEAVSRLPIRVLGAVLNDIQSGEGYDSYYHQYSYLPGYETSEEDVSVKVPVKRLPGKR